VSAPVWYKCDEYGRYQCAHNFIQELCDLALCHQMIEAHEKRARQTFGIVLRMRADLYYEARWSFPPDYRPNTVYVPRQESSWDHFSVNDHVAVGDRCAMRSYLLRLRHVHRRISYAAELARLFRWDGAKEMGMLLPGRAKGRAFAALANPKHKMTSEIFLGLALFGDSVLWHKEAAWMYCVHTRRALLDQHYVYGCIARIRARTRCTSLVCNVADVKYWCQCYNVSCEALKAHAQVSSMSPFEVHRLKEGLTYRGACVDMLHSQLLHRDGCPWSREDFLRPEHSNKTMGRRSGQSVERSRIVDGPILLKMRRSVQAALGEQARGFVVQSRIKPSQCS
jgi:hypothetical protein